MATLPINEEVALSILTQFIRHQRKAGEILMQGHVFAALSEEGYSADAIKAGVAHALSEGWLEVIDSARMFRMTKVGFAKTPAL